MSVGTKLVDQSPAPSKGQQPRRPPIETLSWPKSISRPRSRRFDVLVGRWVEHVRDVGSLVVRALALLDTYGPAVMREAVAEMAAHGTHDIGALAVMCEQRRRSRRSPPPPIVEFAPHVRERDVVPHDLGGYDE